MINHEITLGDVSATSTADADRRNRRAVPTELVGDVVSRFPHFSHPIWAPARRWVRR